MCVHKGCRHVVRGMIDRCIAHHRVRVLFTSVIIVSVRNGLARRCMYASSAATAALRISRDSQKRRTRRKSSDSIVILSFFFIRSQITACPDERQENVTKKDRLGCRQDMKIKIEEEERSETSNKHAGVCFHCLSDERKQRERDR